MPFSVDCPLSLIHTCEWSVGLPQDWEKTGKVGTGKEIDGLVIPQTCYSAGGNQRLFSVCISNECVTSVSVKANWCPRNWCVMRTGKKHLIMNWIFVK